MFQDVVLVHYPPEAEAPIVKTIKARPIGRVVPWCDYSQPGSGGFSLIFVGEDGLCYVQHIDHFSNPFRVFYRLYIYHTVEEGLLNGSISGAERWDFEKILKLHF